LRSDKRGTVMTKKVERRKLQRQTEKKTFSAKEKDELFIKTISIR
jgi:hypothetical protein